MIHVLATIELRPGARDAFLADFARLAPEVHAEDGCLEYGAGVDLPSGLALQGPVRDDVITVVEKWASLAALEAHLAAPHMDAHRARVRDLVVRTTLQILARAGERR
jgi:quinol monooxygenase YgiN